MSGPTSTTDATLPGPTHLRLLGEHLGIDIGGARLLHRRSNAVWHLPAVDAVARLAPDTPTRRERAHTAVELSRWLATQKPPIALPPLKSLAPAPVLVPGAVVTLWPYRPPLGEPGPEQVAAVLRRLHSLPAPPSTIPVPSYRPLHRLDEALAVDAARKHPVLTPQDTRWLIEQARLLRNELEELPRTDHALVHGDAHPENLLPTGHGWLLIDWDGACLGPRVLDLLPTGFPGRFARPDASDRRLFWGAYGPSTHHEQEVRVLQAIGELHSLGAYLRLAADSPAHADQLQLRIRSLVNDDPTALWRPVR